MAPPAPDPRASPRAMARAGVGDDDAPATFSGRDVANAPPGALAQTSMRRRLGIPVAYSSRKARRDMFAPSLVVPGGDPRDAAIDDDEDPPPGEDYHHDAEADDRLERYSDISSVSGYSDRLSTASGYTGLSGISGMYYPPSAAGHAPHDHFHVPGPRNPRESRESNPAVAIAADDPDDVDAPRATPSERADAIAKRDDGVLRVGGSKQKNPDENTAVQRSSSRRDAAARRRPPPDENDLIEAAAFGPRLRSARGGSSRDLLQLGGGFGFRRVGSSSSFASFASSKSRGSDASSEASRRDPEALYGHLETLAEAARATPDAVEAVRFFLARRAREEGVVVFAGGGEEGDEGVGDDAAEESSASKSGDASSSSSVAMKRTYAAFANELDQGRAALHVAAERDDSRLAIALIDSFGADPSIAGALGLTPAHVAAYCGATSTLESILDRGGDVNAADEDGSTPLHWAASAGRADAVRALLGRDDVDAFSKNARGQTAEALGLVSNAKTASAFRDLERAMAPHALARAGKLPILRRMLEREGLDPNVADARGETLAHHAARGGAWRVVEALVAEYGAKPDARCARRGATPVHVAAERGHVAVLDVYHRLAGWERILQTRANAKTFENTTTPEDEGTERGPGAGGSRSKSSRSNNARSNTSRSEKSRSRRRDQDRLERDPAGLALDAGRASGGRMSRSNSYSTLSRSASFRKLERVRSERSLASLLGRFEEDEDDGSFSSDADDSPGLRTASTSRGRKTDFRVAGGSTPAHLAAIAGEAAAIAFLVDKMFAAVDARDADGQTPLHVASARGHVDVVEALLSRGARPDAVDRHGCTPLHVAAEQNREAAARRLLRRDRDPMDPGGDDEKRRGKNLLVAASIDARDSRGNAAAHLAAAMGHASMVLGLLPESTSASRAADAKAAAALAKLRGPRRPGEALEGRGVDATGQCGWTCLHFAAHGGYADLVEALVRDGADVERRDVTGATPTHLACEGGDAGCVEMLLDAARKRDRSSRGDEVGREAGREVEVGAGIEEGLRSHVGLSTDFAVLRMLTAETDAGFSPAHVAALAGHAEVLALLFREAEAEAARLGASPGSIVDVNATTRVGGYAPLHLAAMRKHDAVARLLLRRGARVASTAGDGRAALHFAAASGSLETARLLLDATAKVAASVVNARSLRGETPALLAFGNDHLPTALFLLERGADPFVPDEDGNTCLHACALAGNRDGFLEILRFAYTMGLSMRILRVPNAAGMRPIHLAAQGGSVRMTRCLVDRGADVGAGDLYGRNALMVACESGNLRVAVVLVAHARENGAEPFDADDVTPARLRWMSLRRSLPDIVAAAKSGRVDPAAPNGVAEQALVGFALRRLGLRDDATGGNDEKTFTRDAAASGYDSERSDRSDGSSSSRGELSDVDAVEVNGGLSAGPSAAGVRKVSLLEVLDKAREQFKRRQRDRYVNALSPVTGYGALHVAAERGDVAACRFLLDHGAEIDRRDANRGDAPLHVAAREGRAACVAFLCRRGAKQRAKNETWYTPLHVAAKNGDLATLDALLNALRRNDRNPSSSAETTSEVIDRARRSGTTPLHTAVERRHGGVAARLLASGADWNARTIRNESVIHFAAKAGDADVLAMLLEKRREAMDAAEEREDEEEDSEDSAGAEDEGDAFDDPLTLRDHTESFPLHWAAECGHARCVELLLDANSTPLNIGGMWRGSTAAHLAARQGRLETLELLYERGADVNAQDAWNYATPLIVAAEGGHASTVAFLLAKRVRAEARDKFGTDAAQCAGTAETKMLIRRHTTLRRVRLLLRGADASDCFLGWRDARLDAKATRQRESKGTWQMVFALFGESALARYYWLWRQWHSGNARARRAVGGETAARLVDALEKNPGFAGLARARVVALAEKALRGEDLGEEGGEGGGGGGGESGSRALKRSSDLPRASDRLRSSEYAHHPGVRFLSRGEALWTEGSPNDGRCYAFLSGRADVFMTHETAGGAAEEARVARLRPGSTIGELALRFASAPRTATVRARSETCAVACVHRDAFAAIVAEEHDAIEAEAYARDLEREKRRRLARRRKRGRKRASPTEGAAALERSTVDPDELARFFASYFSRNDDDTERKGASRRSAPRRALSAWEAELLRATLTVATFEPGDACPVAEPAERAPTRGAADASRTSSNKPEHLRTNDGLDRRRVYDVEDGFVGLVLSGEVVTVDAADAREVVRAGEAYVSIASRATRRSRVELRGCCTCYVAADARSPARVAVLQGLDLKDLPETFRATFLGDQFAVPKFWDPPPRDMPRSTADYAEDEGNESWDSEDSEDSEEEDEASDVRRRGATRSDDGSNPDGSRDVSSDSDSDSDASEALDARGLRPEFVTQLVEAFRFVDTDNGGDIDENELKFAARALGFEPDPRELKAMLAAMDEDGGGTVDLGEFVGTVTKRVREVTSEAALDDGFDAFDADRKGFIVLEDVAKAAKRLGDNVTSEELDALMDLGAADLNDDGEIDRDEFAQIMDFRAVGPGRRRAAIREEIKRQARAASEAEVVAEMLGEYGRRRNGGARTGEPSDADAEPSRLRASLVAVFASILGPERDPSSGAEIDVRDLIDALRRDGDGDGSLAKMLHLPSRIRADDGSAAAFEKIFREIDADGSGAIDVEEFVEYFRNLKKEKATEIVARAISRFEEVDEDEDEEGEEGKGARE